MEVATSFRPSPCQVGMGVRRDGRECRESTGREPSSPPIAGEVRRYPRLLQARRSREISAAAHGYPMPAAHPSPPFTEMTPPSVAHRARHSREMMPPSAAPRARRSREMTPPSAAHPGPPFAGDHAAVRGSPRPAVRRRSRRRPAADSMPAGPPLTLAPWIQSTCYGQECRFLSRVVPTGTF